MAGARIEITKDTASPAVQGAISSLTGDGPTLMLADIGEYLVRATRDRAAAQVSPDGTAWEPLSPRYKKFKDKKRPGVPILRFDFHMLGDQLTHQVDGHDLYVGTNAKYGAIHQFGGDIDVAARTTELHFKRDRDGEVGNRFVKKKHSNFSQEATLSAHKISIPARPWLGLSDADETEVLAIASDHLSGLFAPRA